MSEAGVACSHCKPEIMKLCSQCDSDGGDCWMCGGTGWVEAELDDDASLLIVHEDTCTKRG